MSQKIYYTVCPVCNATNISACLTAKDYTVGKEEFSIWECKSCTARFTQDVPDAASIGPYYKSEQYISHTDTSKGFINQLYKKIRKKTLQQKRRLIEKTTGIRNGNLLDIGSGTGAFANEMKQAGWNVTGLEPDSDARQVAKDMYQLSLQDTNAFYDLHPESYDAITLWHVLEHVHDLQGYVTKFKSLLNQNGRLFIAVPNYTSKDAAIYREYWAAYDVPRHLYHFSPEAMRVLMEKHGFIIEAYKPMWYDSFYVSMLSSKYKNGKTNLIAAVFNGMRSNAKAMGNTKRCSSVIYIVRKK